MLRAALPALVASVIATSSVGAETSVASFYRNKNIDVYIGFSVGGVYDINARLLARYMGRYIPGNPTIVGLFRISVSIETCLLRARAENTAINGVTNSPKVRGRALRFSR